MKNNLKSKITDTLGIWSKTVAGEQAVNDLFNLFTEEMLRVVGEDEVEKINRLANPTFPYSSRDNARVRNALRSELREEIKKL